MLKRLALICTGIAIILFALHMYQEATFLCSLVFMHRFKPSPNHCIGWIGSSYKTQAMRKKMGDIRIYREPVTLITLLGGDARKGKMNRTIDKAFLQYYDDNGFGHKSAEEVRTAKLAFKAGYKAAQQTIAPDKATCSICSDELDFCRSCYTNELADSFAGEL